MTDEVPHQQQLESARQRVQRLKQRLLTNPAPNHGTAIVRPIAQRITPSHNHAALHRPIAQRLAPPPRTNSWYSGAATVNRRTAGGRKMKSAESLNRKYKASWYHQVAAKNRLGAINEDCHVSVVGEEDEADKPTATIEVASFHQCKHDLMHELNRTGGESNTPAFQAALQKLLQQYDSSQFDPRSHLSSRYGGLGLEGVGISAGKPTFPGCIGRNDQGDAMYKLGTMSFDMFSPTELVCSVQGTFVFIDVVDGRNPNGVKNVPSNLLADVRFGHSPVRTYDIVTPITIEPWKPEFGQDSPNKGIDQPIRGVLTSYGFILPYPKGNRFSVWFTGGSLEVGDDQTNEKWFQIFDKGTELQRNTAPESPSPNDNKIQMAKQLLGAINGELDNNGKLTYALTKPQASTIDLLYLDETLQVLRSTKSGIVYTHVRLPGSGAVRQSMLTKDKLPAPQDPLAANKSDHVPGIGNVVRRVQSTSNVKKAMMQLQQSPQVAAYMSASEARLQELEQFAIPLKKSSSHQGQLEDHSGRQQGTTGISSSSSSGSQRNAEWNKAKTQDSNNNSKDDKKEEKKKLLNRLRRTLSAGDSSQSAPALTKKAEEEKPKELVSSSKNKVIISTHSMNSTTFMGTTTTSDNKQIMRKAEKSLKKIQRNMNQPATAPRGFKKPKPKNGVAGVA